MPEPRIANELSSTKYQIEAELKLKLQTSRLEYETASEAYKRTLKRCDETPPKDHAQNNGKPRPPEQSATDAVSAQHHAFKNYRRALDEYNKFLLYGDLPAWP